MLLIGSHDVKQIGSIKRKTQAGCCVTALRQNKPAANSTSAVRLFLSSRERRRFWIACGWRDAAQYGR
ncbi:hypothetical protein, partial [Lactobacillus crispatus]|uniref:hypothetical protein n=1 Tax=Lactobacillus crispatus TaxID=47770 RepID=UPI00197B337E